jgi:hypothetical protein
MRTTLLLAAGCLLLALRPAFGEEKPLPQPQPCCDPSLRFIGDDYAPFREEGKVGFRNADGKVVIPPQFEDTLGFSEAYAPVKLGGKWGMVDHLGKVLGTGTHWFSLSQFHEGVAVTREKEGGEVFYLNRNKGNGVPGVFADAADFSEGLAGATQDGKKWGFIDFRGKFVIEPQFEEVGPFCEGLASFRRGKHFGFLNRRGEVEIDPKFDSVATFSAGRVLAALSGKGVMANRLGETLGDGPDNLEQNAHGKRVPASCRCFPELKAFPKLPFPIDDTGLPFSEGLTPIKSKGKWGVIDYQGAVIVPLLFDDLRPFREGVAAVRLDMNGPYGFLDRTGRVVIEPTFESTMEFRNGLAPASDGRKWGVIDHKGKWVVKPQYDRIGIFREGLTWFRLGTRTGFLAADGTVIIEPRYDSASSFEGGRAMIYIKNALGQRQGAFIDKYGTITSEFRLLQR